MLIDKIKSLFRKKNLIEVKVRYNNDISSPYRWRIISCGVECLADEIEINCKSFTTTDTIGAMVKYHICCNVKQFSIIYKAGKKKVVLY